MYRGIETTGEKADKLSSLKIKVESLMFFCHSELDSESKLKSSWMSF